jgi:hypothetical protein
MTIAQDVATFKRGNVTRELFFITAREIIIDENTQAAPVYPETDVRETTN